MDQHNVKVQNTILAQKCFKRTDKIKKSSQPKIVSALECVMKIISVSHGSKMYTF